MLDLAQAWLLTPVLGTHLKTCPPFLDREDGRPAPTERKADICAHPCPAQEEKDKGPGAQVCLVQGFKAEGAHKAEILLEYLTQCSICRHQ